MHFDECGTPRVDDIIADIEETVERANLLALELALKSLENSDLNDVYNTEINSMTQLADRAAHATGEIERLVRKLKAA